MHKLILIAFLSIASFHCISQPINLEAYWQDRLKFRSTGDRKFEFAAGGRIHFDAAIARQSKALDTLAEPIDPTMRIRRARVTFSGSYDNAIEYEIEFTFSEGIRMGDVYVSFLKIPHIERLTVGHFREPVGMEENYSSNSILFMERSLTSAFAPGRNVGIMLQRKLGEKARIYSGVYRRTNSSGEDEDEDVRFSVASRLAFNPLYNKEKNQALHIGISNSVYTPTANVYSVQTDNETHTGATYIRSGEIKDVNKIVQLAGELGYSFKRFNFQSEFLRTYTILGSPTDSLGDPRKTAFNTYYAYASYFLKGGRRQYDRASNYFDDIALDEKQNGSSMRGAWEVGVRYAYIDLTESVSVLERMSDLTVGLNYYLNSNSRLMLNMVVSRIERRFNATSLQGRVQFTF
ncbi:OprO/OprP family phosphate-selective porin [Aridibaculum aurantiacum]|uniref:OprO/OprP family phosphate-selective porin n=1 Tax=Aridibaculum aurantiacum TaxID=2810307 RepID=UPI001A978AF4|nr:porin [Aridibaculum aurantiacum]